MNTVVVASTGADAAAAEAVAEHHAVMAGALAVQVDALVAAVSAGDRTRSDAARATLVDWCLTELLPHAAAEESSLYPAAQADPTARLLVDAMLAEHAVITRLVEDLRTGTEPVRTVGTATALRVLFDTHLAKENDQLVPLLAASATFSLSDALADMHELLGEATEEGAVNGCGGACGCAETDSNEWPELDARSVPHAIRHATVFGALDAVQPGGGLVLLAPHDPLPLLAQLEKRTPGAFTVDYLERGPESWRLRLARA